MAKACLAYCARTRPFLVCHSMTPGFVCTLLKALCCPNPCTCCPCVSYSRRCPCPVRPLSSWCVTRAGPSSSAQAPSHTWPSSPLSWAPHSSVSSVLAVTRPHASTLRTASSAACLLAARYVYVCVSVCVKHALACRGLNAGLLMFAMHACTCACACVLFHRCCSGSQARCPRRRQSLCLQRPSSAARKCTYTHTHSYAHALRHTHVPCRR